jgi:predicted N-acetyltransferase YhbS
VTGSTQIRFAESQADRLAACSVAGAVFTPADRPWVQQALRLACPRRSQGDAWLLEEGGQVVCSLLSYPLEFVKPDGATSPGFGFGAVATLPSARRRGHAAALCEHVTKHEIERGRPLGLLFAAIDPAYYERLGWRCVPAWAHQTGRLTELADGPRADWHPIDPRRARPALTALYDDAHRGSLHMRRDAAGWAQSIEGEPNDLWLGLGEPGGPLRGYTRFGRGKRTLSIAELVLSEPGEQERALRGLAGLALELKLERLLCWLPPSPALDTGFEAGDRSQDLPMVLGIEPEQALFSMSDHF